VASPLVVCVGETLWDVLPHGEFLGGAPLNVAAHLARLGIDTRLVSRVGEDRRGREALARIATLGLDTALVQRDPEQATGIAEAVVDASGSASYRFPGPAAWDALQAPATALAAASSGTVVFGTLGQRSAASAEAIGRLLAAARWAVFDANLRPPHDDRDVALRSLGQAHFVKLNDDEVRVFARWLGVAATPEALWQRFGAEFGTRSLCVTEGARGARLWHAGSYVEQPAQPAVVVDTIGAGDSFLAMLLAGLLRGSAPRTAMARAARLAAFVASHRGATPDYDPASFLG
jgi:fructokinase